MDLLSRLRDNTIIFTLKQNIESYLNNDLSPDQVQLRDFRLTLHDLNFNAEKINRHLPLSGDGCIRLRSCTVRRMEIDTAALCFDVNGVEIAIGAEANLGPRRPGAEQKMGPLPPGEQAGTTGHVKALAMCLAELSGLLSAYLRIVITDLRLSLYFTIFDVVAEKSAIFVDIIIPELDFRDTTGEWFNNSLSAVPESSSLRKIIEMKSFTISLDGRRVAHSSHPLSVGIDIKGSNNSRQRTRIVAQLEDLFVEMCSEQAAACIALFEFVAKVRSEDPSHEGVPAYQPESCSLLRVRSSLHADSGSVQAQDNEKALMFLKDIPNLSSDDIERGRLFQLYEDKLYSLTSEHEGSSSSGNIDGCDKLGADVDDYMFFDCSDATPSDDIRKSHDLHSGPSQLLEVELDFTNRLTMVLSNPTSMGVLTLQLSDTTVRLQTYVNRLEVDTNSNAGGDGESAMHVTIKSLELSSAHDDDVDVCILASCTGARTLQCTNHGTPSFEVSLDKRTDGANELLSVECALTRLNVNLDVARMTVWIRTLQELGITGKDDAKLTTDIILRLSVISCAAILPLSKTPQFFIHSSDTRWGSMGYPCLRHARPASLILELCHVNASLSSAIEGVNDESGIYFGVSAAMSYLYFIPDQSNPLRALRLLSVKGVDVTSQAAKTAALFRMRFRDGDSTSSVRSWDPRKSSENSAALVPSKLNDKPMTTASQLPMKGILVSSANILITISMGEVAVLLYHINEASESLCRLRHCPGPEIPHDTHPISVFLDIQRIHGTLFRQSVPCARLVVVELIGAFEASGKDVCFGAKDFEILSTIKQHSWKSFVGRAPQVQSKPPALLEHSMLTVQVDPRGLRVQLRNVIIRHGNHGVLVDELRDASFLKCSEGYAAQPSYRTIHITADDFHVECIGSSSSLEICARTVLEFTRVVVNTTMLVPVLASQRAMLSTDHVRLLLAHRSEPYSTLTENNFVQVALLPGERCISARFTADADKCCVSAILDVTELSVSFCADSLDTLLGLLGAMNETVDSGSNATSGGRDAKRQTATRSKGRLDDCSSMFRREYPYDCEGGFPTMATYLDDFTQRDNLSALPSTEDFFLPSTAKGCLDLQPELGNSASGRATNDRCAERHSRRGAWGNVTHRDDGEKEDNDEEWVLNGFYNTTCSTELEELEKSDPGISVSNKEADLGGDDDDDDDDDTACWAGWYGGAIGPSNYPALKVHHVPVPVKPTCLRSVLKAPGSDIQISIHKTVIRMFGGLDWAPLNSLPVHETNTANHSSSMLLGSPRNLPAGMLASIHPDYFDGASGTLPLRRALGDERDDDLVRPLSKEPDAGSNSGDRANQLASVKRGSHSTRSNCSRTRDADAVTEISVLSAKLRWTDITCSFFDKTTKPRKFQPQLIHQKREVLNGHVNLALNFNVSHSSRGKSKNCLYEWRSAGQAHEELDQYGQPVKMFSIEIFDVCSVVGAPKAHQVDIRLRPLRCCANWDLIEFLQSFCGNIETSAKETKVQTPAVRKVELGHPDLVQRGYVHAFALKIDLDTRLVELGAIQRGEVQELLKLFPLEGVELQLQPVRCECVQGSLFFNEIFPSWVRDITSSQLHKFIAGAGPMRPLSTVGYNAANVVLLPLQEYQEGGRILHGLRKGAAGFVKSLTIESMHASSKISQRVAGSLDCLAEMGPSSRHGSMGHIALRPQPANLQSGLKQAQESLSAGLNTAAHAIIAISLDEPLQGAIRAFPIAFLAPVIGAAEAASYTLLGIRNAMSPDRRYDEERQYKGL